MDQSSTEAREEQDNPFAGEVIGLVLNSVSAFRGILECWRNVCYGKCGDLCPCTTFVICRPKPIQSNHCI